MRVHDTCATFGLPEGPVRTPTSWPRRYETGVTLDGDQVVVDAAGRPEIVGGRGGRWSGGHLLLAALNVGLATTFDELVRAARIEIFGYRARAVGIADLVEGRPVFTAFEVTVELEVKARDGSRVRELMEQAKAQCAVSRALGRAVSIRVDIGAVR